MNHKLVNGIIVTTVIFASGCGEQKSPDPTYRQPTLPSTGQQTAATGTPTQPGSSDALDSNPTTPEGKAALIKELEARNTAESQELMLLKKINEKFCIRLDRLRSECAASVRLIADSSEKILGCDRKSSDNTAIRHTFKVSISGVSGEYAIVADKTFSSGNFGAGDKEITFSTSGSTAAQSPRLMDVSNLRVTAKSGGLPNLNSVRFSLKVDETEVFNQGDLTSGESGSWSINPLSLEKFRRSQSCSVGDTELDDMTNDAKKEVGAGGGSATGNSSTPATGQDNTKTSKPGDTGKLR